MTNCELASIETPAGPRRVCLIAAPRAVDLTTRGPAALRVWTDPSSWLEFVLAERPDAVLLRSRRAIRDASLRLDPTLDDDELQTLADGIVRAQLDAWRVLLRAGMLVGRVELRVRELHVLRNASERLARELKEGSEDAGYIRQQMFYCGAGLGTVLEQLLPLRFGPRRPPRGHATLRELARLGA